MMIDNFHRTVRGHFDTSPEVAFTILEVWGDMMEKVHEWPGSDDAFVDVLVARLRKQIEVKT